REVCHRTRPQDRSVHRPPRIGVLEVFGQPPEGVVDSRVKRHVGRPTLKLFRRQPLEILDGIVIDLVPEVGVELSKERDDVGLPDPPQIAGQVSKFVYQLRLTHQVSPPENRGSRKPYTTGVSNKPCHPGRATM